MRVLKTITRIRDVGIPAPQIPLKTGKRNMAYPLAGVVLQEAQL